MMGIIPGMLCQKCRFREACCIVTSCNGIDCYELHLCLTCRDTPGPAPRAEDQLALVAPAMEDAHKKGLSDEDVARVLDIDAQEIRRIMDGIGVSEPTVWEKIRTRLVIEEK
jgi:hypothetical protein